MVGLLLLPLAFYGHAQSVTPIGARLNALSTILTYLNPSKDFVQAGDKCYCLLQPKTIADGKFEDVRWSSDGKTLFYLKQTAEPTFDSTLQLQNADALKAQTLYEWDASTGESSEILTLDGEHRKLEEFAGLNGSSTIFVELDERQPSGPDIYSIYRFSASDTAGTLVYSSHDSIYIQPAPNRPVALLEPGDFRDTTFAMLVDGSGNSVSIQTHDPKIGLLTFDGSGHLAFLQIRTDSVTGKRDMLLHPVDERSGKILMDERSKDQSLPPGDGSPETPIQLRFGSTISSFPGRSDKPKSQDHSIWLGPSDEDDSKDQKKLDFPYALVAADSSTGWLSPALNGVCYESQGALMVRPIMPVDLETMKLMAKLERRQVAISNAKQVALGMIMYANDYDDHLPNPGNWNSALNPYLKDPSISSGFVYSYSGDLNMNNIQNPATTVLGYISTEDGQAIAYTDGHVVWQPKP